MSESMPEFRTDAEMVEWFENADLTQYELDEVLRVAAQHVELTIEGADPGDSSAGATLEARLEGDLATNGR